MKTMLKKRPVRLLLCVLAASCLFLFLYLFDNKYTQRAIQPADGLLILSQDDLDRRPLRFLTSGWACYPDCLLTPEDFDEGLPDHYLTYTQIGQSVRFDRMGQRRAPHGSATYVLYLNLPAGKTYALELPEVFSACRLYVDDTLAAEVGNPDPDAYEARTQSRLVTFVSGGHTRLILSVSDYSHYYSGLVYPPAFGTPAAVLTYQNLRIGLSLSACVLTSLIALGLLYLGLRMKRRNALPFSLLCAATVGFISYPILHSFFELSIFPWYTLELLCGYLVSFLVVFLHNRLCAAGRRTALISQGTALSMLVLAGLYGLCSPLLTVPVMDVFSVLSVLYKAALSLYLIGTAARAVRRQDPETFCLLCGASFYGTAFLWDCLLPSFEPVYGGWFSEWGTAVLLLAILYTFWKDLASAYAFRYIFMEERRQLTRQVAIQQAHYQALTEKIDETIRIRHDERHHMQTLSAYLENGQYGQMRDYLAEYLRADSQSGRTVLCRNLTVDAILQYYMGLCRDRSISLSVSAPIPARIPVGDTDLSILFGNLLENAFEAALNDASGHPFIRVQAGWKDGKLYVRVENSHSHPVRTHQGRYLSTKHDGYGIGTESVRALAKRNGGQIKFDVTDRTFRVSVILVSSNTV
ncbi:MAG: GHKL domain-containing protein [Eubacteriales bacterium]|nr:GHKL domain-containing protein [Eubacteriales bacterium]